MAARTLPFSDWLRLVVKHALGGEFGNLSGFPVVDVARKLAVTEQRVRQLIAEGTLDTLHVTNADGKVSLSLITEASLDRYLAKRVPDRNRQGYFAFPS